MIDQLKSMAIFVTVVEANSFRGAAERLQLSPSVVSSHITKLEKQVGAALLYRSTRALSLTREGERFYVSAQKMVQSARSGLNLFSGSAPEKLTEIRIAMPVTLCTHPTFLKIIDFIDDHSGVMVTLLSSDRPQDLLKDGIDVAVRMGNFRDSDMKTRNIGEARRAIVAAPSYIAMKNKPAQPRDLLNWDFISFALVPDTVSLTRPGQKPQVVWGKTVAVADSVETMRALAIAGMGLTALPLHAVQDDIEQNRLVEVLPDWTEQILAINLTWPRNANLNRSAREFIDFMSV